jgi:dienelactone hydrolase
MERKRASDFPQELLNLFDRYVHGGIDRREFLDGAQKFAVGGVTAAALFEMLKPNYAWAIQVQKEDNRIKAESATVPSPQGNGSIKGYLVRPANATGKLPAILVVHENRGLNPYIEDVARRLAIVNFIAFAPDGLTSVGGQPSADDAAKIKAPLLAHYGELDTRITSGWPAFDAALTAAHVPHEGYVYMGANHGFHNDTTPRYDEAAAKLAWQRTLDWFNKYLRSAG